ncbi:MAG: hypothetical protein K2O36_04930 [Ruminococcus sp.]|nr:hypothetical protein [Ruminococcus sp.]
MSDSVSLSSHDSESSNSTEKNEDIVLTVAMSGDSSQMTDIIKEFNELDNGYRVEIKQYGNDLDMMDDTVDLSPEYYAQLDFEIIQDIINSDEIDIVCNNSFFNECNYRILQNKEAFVDLYSFMENDSEVNKTTLNNHILNVNEIDGKLYTLPTFYAVNTLVGDTQYVGSKENWTIDEFISHWNEMPDGTTIAGATAKENVYRSLLQFNLSNFIDYDNAEVHFDSSEFKGMLEFCNSFPSMVGEKGTYDYDAVSFVDSVIIDQIMSAQMFSEENGKTFVGYPSSDGNGAYFTPYGICYSISAKSSPEEQKGAWEFIRTFVTEEWQIENVIPFIEEAGPIEHYSTELGLCVNNNAFDKIADGLINHEYYSATFVDKDIEYERYFPTEEDVDKLKAYIDTINLWGTVVDDSLWEIIRDEVFTYFNGETTIDECIDFIQNRASIWISEQS